MRCNLHQHNEHVVCTEKIVNLGEKDYDEIASVFTECGLLPAASQHLNVCTNHYYLLLERNKKRKRRRLCSVPVLLNCHQNSERKSDREITLRQVTQINTTFGVVLPIGSGICRCCRKKLIQDSSSHGSTEHAEREEKINEERKSLVEDVHVNVDDHEIPLKRLRKNDPTANVSCPELELFNSQHSLSQSSATSCDSTLDGYRQDAQREAFNNFLALSGISPIKQVQGRISDASKRTQQRYIKKATDCMQMICKTICPSEGNFLKATLNLEHEEPTYDHSSSPTKDLETLTEIYKRADTWNFQRQVLSIIAAEHSFNEVKKLIPDVTQYKFKTARKHSREYGIGEPIPKTKNTKEKYELEQLDFFIDFITSGQIIKDQPFGEKTLKLNGGEVIKIPSVIRSLAPSRIVSQYLAVCKEENVKPLGSSTVYKLLDECSAMVRQSIEGIDNFVMEGCRAFQDLENVIQKLELLQGDETKKLMENLQNVKRYLKSELKVHTSRENQVADHCLSFALSCNDPSFKTVCDHDHSMSCLDCENLDSTLTSIKEKATEKTWENREAVLYTVEESISAIYKWKSHVVRCRNQEEARSAIVDSMGSDSAVITCDWAMKFLPRKYREGQVDWFAKRGINWHITVTLIKDNNSFKTVTHVHIFENPISQDAATTSQIIVDTSKDIISNRTGVRNLHIFSDNAGCYKSSLTLALLRKELSSNIVSYNFSEAQNGKGPCDRRASHIKSIIRRYINEGNDVTTALQMKQAIDREGKDDIRVKVVATVNILCETSNKCTIPNISQMYNFYFAEEGLRVWKAFSVGQGKLLSWASIGTPCKTIELKVIADWTGEEVFRLHEVQESSAVSNTCVFECPEESCTKTFTSIKSVDEHVSRGNCTLNGVSMNISERAKRMYADRITSLQPQKTNYMIPHTDTHHLQNASSLALGWAIKENKSRVTFSSRQKDFMVEKFNIGKTTGNKVDPFVAAEEMRNSGKFKRVEFLSGSQISSFFSRMCQKEKKMTPEDYNAALDEDRKDKLKTILIKKNDA